jgi:hypothetical protein
MTLPPAEVARLDSYARHMRTLLCALFLVALMSNLIPRAEGAFPAETVSGEVER